MTRQKVALAPKPAPHRVALLPNIHPTSGLTCENTKGWHMWHFIRKVSSRTRVTCARKKKFWTKCHSCHPGVSV